MIIVRLLRSQEFYLERVVFPFELLSFEAPLGSELEIWTHGLGGPELLGDRSRLRTDDRGRRQTPCLNIDPQASAAQAAFNLPPVTN